MTFPHMRAAVAPRTVHVHAGCGHGCICRSKGRASCRTCRTEAFNAAMARRRYEDSLTTEQLLTRRA